MNKNIYGDKRSDKKGWKAKINVGADGDFFELVENAQYDGSKPEKGKKIAAHRGVGSWDYFIKNVQVDGTVFDLVANVRKKADGAFVYSIQLNENKKIKASPPLGSLSRASSGVPNAFGTNITQPAKNVNTHSNPNAQLQRREAAISDWEVLDRASEALGEMIEIATNRRWEATKHTASKDAKYGMYRYDTKFAFPVKDQKGNVTSVKAYDAELLIRNASNGKKYLYDIVNIKEDTANAIDLRHKEARKGSHMAATQSGVPTQRVTQNANGVNKKFSLRDSEGRELTREQKEFFKDSTATGRNRSIWQIRHMKRA